MALTLESINLVKQRTRGESRCPGVHEVLRALWKHMEQRRNPDLQFVPLDYTLNAEQTIADVPARLFALYLKKPAASTVAAWVKCTDEASAANEAHGDLSVKFDAALASPKEHCLVFPDGLSFATGIMTVCHTANDSATDSQDADSPGGFAIVGAY